MTAIETKDLRKEYGDVVALEGINLTVDEGEVFGFLGPNGAGKSTTINILLDFVRPTSGSATVLGMDAQARSKDIRQRIGVLPEGYDVYDRLTGREHLEFAIESKQADDDPEELLERVGLADDADRKAGGYSKGMSQRLMLAVALVGDPDLLILDEPTTGLDPNGAREMRELVREEVAKGRTVFFSSHILDQVEAVCDRVGILQEGKLVAVDTVEGLQASTSGAPKLTLSVRDFGDDALAAVEDLADGDEVTTEDRGSETVVTLHYDGSKMDVVHAIEEAGAEVKDFSTEEDSLDEVFHAYTAEVAK